MPKPAAPGRDAGYVALLIAGLATALGALAYANFRFEPYSFDRRAWAKVVHECLEAGRHFKYRDANANYRMFRREELRALREAPEIAFVGSSHHRTLSDAMFPGHTVRNFYIHQPRTIEAATTLDSLADTFAVPELLFQQKKLPKIYIMSLTLNPYLRKRKGDDFRNDWRELAPEYAAMARRLGLPPPDPIQSFPKLYFQSILSASRLQRQLELREKYPDSDVCTDETKGELSILHPDGSTTMQAKLREKESLAWSRKDAIESGAIERSYRVTMDAQVVDALGRLIEFLKREGVQQVVMFLTPHHPLFYKGLEGTEHRRDIEGIEAKLHRLAQERGFTVAGSYDPAKTDCVETEFYGSIHIGETCAAKILRQAVHLEPRPDVAAIPLGRYEPTLAERGGAPAPDPADVATAKKEGH